MRLSRRLMLLIVLCLLPMVAAAVLTLATLYRQRGTELASVTRRQVDLADADLLSIFDGARGVLAAVSEAPTGPDCAARLTALQRELPAYRFIAVVDRPAGGGLAGVLCVSGGDLSGALLRPEWLALLPAGTGFHVGRYATVQAASRAAGPANPAFLPIVLRRPTPDGGERTVLAGLDLHWLGLHLAAQRRAGGALFANGVTAVIDQGGTMLARVPDSDRFAGTRVSSETRAVTREAAPPVELLRGLDRRPRLVAFSPAGALPDGIAVAAGLDPGPFLVGIQDVLIQTMALGLAAVLVALLIASFAARRAIHRPAERLLAAARSWRAGDLTARADMRGDRSEFGFLGTAFNQMASDIEARLAAHGQQAQQLEARVAERTQELSASNNRLQVEIAERQRAETGLHQAQKLQAVGQLAGGIAHDFNNLLATILGSIELIERRLTSSDERLGPLLKRAMEAVQRGSQLTSRLLAFSRRQRLAARPTDLNRLVADLVTLATSTLGRRIRIQTDFAPDLWPAMADTSQLEAAILNLALNARDAMPQGGVLTFATGNETIPEDNAEAEPGDYVGITVTDTGVGMSRETMARAFDPFFTTKELGKGSGLGLSQVYGLARQSGGTVRIQSELGHGTTVALLMPRATELVPAFEPVAPTRTRPRGVAELVLLVDDDPDVRHVSVDMLRDLGYEVAEAGDGEEALATVRQLPSAPALLVLDYAMPGMNGLQLAARLRALGITAPLLLATGYAELTEDISGTRPDAILHKPFTLVELERTLTRLRAHANEAA